MPKSLDEALDMAEELEKKARKPGFLTSEFWLAAATTLTGILVKTGVLASETTAPAQVISSLMVIAGPVAYILARSGLKKGLAEVLTHLTNQAAKEE